MALLPSSTGAVALALCYWPILPGDPDKGYVPVLVQLSLLAFVVCVLAFVIGGIFVLTDYIRTRKEKRRSSV
jgi:hypothetical protein